MNTANPENNDVLSIDVLLLCALQDEYSEVLAVNEGLISPGWVEKNVSGRVVADAQFTALDDSMITIRVTWGAYMGREQAQAVAGKLINDTPVKCIAMCGICAGRRGKVELGDVIFAERLWSYDAGKTVVEEDVTLFQGDGLHYRPKEVWVQQMQHLAIPGTSDWLVDRPLLPLEHQEVWVLERLRDLEDPLFHQDFATACPDWSLVLPRLKKQGWIGTPLRITDEGKNYIDAISTKYPAGMPAPAKFKTHVAPMATGAAVVEDSGIFPRLSKSMRKVLGIDMEASGLAALSEMNDIPIVVAKGVQDFGDPLKDDRYRQFAARASAESIILFLRKVSHLYLVDNSPVVATKGIRPNVTDPHSSADLCRELADLYSTHDDICALWERAGGRAGEVSNIQQPMVLWQRLWRHTKKGAAVTPKALLSEVLEEYPNNSNISKLLGELH